MRLFVGINLPKQLKQTLVEFQSELQELGIRASWKSPENFHLTLEFLGELGPSSLPAIVEALIKGAEKSKPFHLSVVGLGAFPSLARPRVLWTGMGGSLTELDVLQANLHQELLKSGFTLENRHFKSHITLASHPQLSKLKVSSVMEKQFGEFLVSDFGLIDSKELCGKRIYTTLAEIKLR